MEYINKNPICNLFNQQIIQQIILNQPPSISPSKKINNSNKESMKYWQLFCYSNPNVSLVVKLDSKMKKTFLKEFTIPINNDELFSIQFQCNFIKMKFTNFAQFITNLPKKQHQQYEEKKKDHILYIYIVEGVKKEKCLYQSMNFYELIEGAKLFLHENNYTIFSKQLFIIQCNNHFMSIKQFFKIKFLKFYLYNNYGIDEIEDTMLVGSYLLFCLGIRIPRDIDFYSLGDLKMPSVMGNCGYEITYISNYDNKVRKYWERVIREEYYYLFGMKTNTLEEEVNKRYKRLEEMKSGKALADLVILMYLYRIKLKIELDTGGKDIEKVLRQRYFYFDRNKIMNYLKQK